MYLISFCLHFLICKTVNIEMPKDVNRRLYNSGYLGPPLAQICAEPFVSSLSGLNEDLHDIRLVNISGEEGNPGERLYVHVDCEESHDSETIIQQHNN